MSGTSLQVTGTGANPLFFTDITTGSGRIGIGTNSPATSLHVAGTMPEHMIQSDIGLNFSQVTRPPAFTASLVAEAGNNDIGNGYYYVSYTTVLGETELSTHTGGSTTGGQLGGLVVSVAGQQQADISVTASTDYRVTGIRIYRSYTTNHYNDVRIVYEAPNTTGTYRVNLADASKTGPSNSYTRDNTTNSFVTVNGSQVMRFSEKNTFFGYQAGESITTGSDNAFFGYQAGGDSTTVSQSVCVGSLCAASGQLSASVAIGYDALRSVTSNSPYSVAIGHQAMRNRANGSRSIGIGRAAATDNDGSYNIFLGDQAGRYITGGSTKNESSDYGVYIGADAKASISDAQNEIAIGYDVTGSGSNTVIIGNDSITDTFLRGNVNISETGNLNFTGAAGLILPVYTDATRPTAGTAGMVIFNSDDNFLNVDDGSNWRDMSGNVT